jgi:hypothetical protein
MENKVWFWENSSGERSHTKLFNIIYSIALIGIWVALSWSKKEIVPFEPTTLIPLGMGQVTNSINKWIETNSNAKQARFIKSIMEKAIKK